MLYFWDMMHECAHVQICNVSTCAINTGVIVATSGLRKLQQHVKHAYLCEIPPQAWEWTSEQVVAQA